MPSAKLLRLASLFPDACDVQKRTFGGAFCLWHIFDAALPGGAEISLHVLNKRKVLGRLFKDDYGSFAEFVRVVRAGHTALARMAHPAFLALRGELHESGRYLAFASERVAETLVDRWHSHNFAQLGAASDADGFDALDVRAGACLLLQGLAFLRAHGALLLDVGPHAVAVCPGGTWKFCSACFLVPEGEGGLQRFPPPADSAVQLTAFPPRFAAPEVVCDGTFAAGSDMFAFASTLSCLFGGFEPAEAARFTRMFPSRFCDVEAVAWEALGSLPGGGAAAMDRRDYQRRLEGIFASARSGIRLGAGAGGGGGASEGAPAPPWLGADALGVWGMCFCPRASQRPAPALLLAALRAPEAELLAAARFPEWLSDAQLVSVFDSPLDLALLASNRRRLESLCEQLIDVLLARVEIARAALRALDALVARALASGAGFFRDFSAFADGVPKAHMPFVALLVRRFVRGTAPFFAHVRAGAVGREEAMLGVALVPLVPFFLQFAPDELGRPLLDWALGPAPPEAVPQLARLFIDVASFHRLCERGGRDLPPSLAALLGTPLQRLVSPERVHPFARENEAAVMRPLVVAAGFLGQFLPPEQLQAFARRCMRSAAPDIRIAVAWLLNSLAERLDVQFVYSEAVPFLSELAAAAAPARGALSKETRLRVICMLSELLSHMQTRAPSARRKKSSEKDEERSPEFVIETPDVAPAPPLAQAPPSLSSPPSVAAEPAPALPANFNARDLLDF
eukprot:gnl/Chilomastix_cuspidata/5458.p1 GENE.gnl/Chilomastix_cuspidata/5458~~gnl/Chilomastix_cuspidata/5458.p1  ORF type:complete len:740 (+),score=297.94 gnl/Chilomastix_cuspidata/5458:390-2609(+)